MKYVTGTYALNLPSPDGTPGDWHFSAIDWRNITVADSDNSVFGDWDIYPGTVPEHGTMSVASHTRACLDLIEQGYFSSAQGMREYFISDENKTPTIFQKVWQLRNKSIWNEIDRFMGREYLCKWLDFKEKANGNV